MYIHHFGPRRTRFETGRRGGASPASTLPINGTGSSISARRLRCRNAQGIGGLVCRDASATCLPSHRLRANRDRGSARPDGVMAPRCRLFTSCSALGPALVDRQTRDHLDSCPIHYFPHKCAHPANSRPSASIYQRLPLGAATS